MPMLTEELREFITDNFLFGQGADLRDETSFLASGIIDSTGMLELIGFIECRYGLRLEDQELTPDNLDSIGKLVGFISGKLAVRAPASDPVQNPVEEPAAEIQGVIA